MLDELGAVKPTEWVWDTVSLILNTRYNDNRTTIITTNFRRSSRARGAAGRSRPRAATRGERPLGDRIGERMRSRLHEMCRIVTMEGTISAKNSAAPVSAKTSRINTFHTDSEYEVNS